MSTITLPSGVEVYEGKILVLPNLGVVMPFGDLTPAEVQALRDDVASVMNLAVGDLANVDDSERSAGYVLQWDAGANEWRAAPNPKGLETAWSPAYAPVATPRSLHFLDGLYLQAHPTNTEVTRVRISMGASGSSESLARADHVHPPTLTGRLDFNKAGSVLGTGINDLVNSSVSGLIPSIVYDVTITGEIEAVCTSASGRLRLHTRIGTGGDIQTLSRGFSGGVWTPVSAHGTRMSATGVTNLALRFWAEYESGDPTALYSGYLAYTIAPRGGTS